MAGVQSGARTQKPSDKECDDIIAALFGGPGAVVATDIDITHADRVDHLADNGVFHIYPNAGGTRAAVGLYVPASSEPISAIGPDLNVDREYNQFNFRWQGIYLSLLHVDNPGINRRDTNSAGSYRIGSIGGPGGGHGVDEESLDYNHSHIIVRSLVVERNKKTGRTTYSPGTILDPRSVFCTEANRRLFRQGRL